MYAEEEAADIARCLGSCRAGACTRPPVQGEGGKATCTCTLCGARYCSPGCKARDLPSHRPMCEFYREDLRLIEEVRAEGRAVLRLEHLVRTGLALRGDVWSLCVCANPLRVVAAAPTLSTAAELDSLLALPAGEVARVLTSCAKLATVENPYVAFASLPRAQTSYAVTNTFLPRHVKAAAAFARKVVLHHGGALLRYVKDDDAVALALFAVVFALNEARAVGPSAACVVPLLARLVKAKSASAKVHLPALACWLVRVLCWAISSTPHAQEQRDRALALLKDVVLAGPPQCCTELLLYRTMAFDIMSATDADDPVANRLLQAAYVTLSVHVPALLAGGDARLLDRVFASLKVVLLVPPYPPDLFRDCFALMDAVGRREDLRCTAAGLHLGNACAILMGSDPEKCAMVAPHLASIMLTADVVRETAPLIKMLIRALAHTRGPVGVGFIFNGGDFAAMLCRVLCEASYHQETDENEAIAVRLAEAIFTRQRGTPLCQAVLERLRARPPDRFVERMCAILRGDTLRCASPGCSRVCRNKVELKLCSRCRCVRYCDRSCQAAHWAAHRAQCNERMGIILLHHLNPMWTLSLP